MSEVVTELDLGDAEVLSREELKKVRGGEVPVVFLEGGGGGHKCNSYCKSDSECDSACPHCDKDGKSHGPGGPICVAFT